MRPRGAYILFENVNTPIRRVFFPPGRRSVSLKSVRVPAKNGLPDESSRAAGQTAIYQTSNKA